MITLPTFAEQLIELLRELIVHGIVRYVIGVEIIVQVSQFREKDNSSAFWLKS